VGSLVVDDLRPGRHLFLLATGTGLAPFMSIIQDPETYERLDKVVLIHGVRWVSELAYADFIERELPADEFLGELVRDKLVYYPTVTREPFRHQGRLTEVIESGRLFTDTGLPPLDPALDRAMICGSPAMLADSCRLLDARGLRVSPRQGEQGDYVIERAFVEK
jgi:ferredoxin--NADP+ reductase